MKVQIYFTYAQLRSTIITQTGSSSKLYILCMLNPKQIAIPVKVPCLNRYSSNDPFHSRFQNVITILPNLVPDVKFWENSITLKKGKKNQRKNLWSYKKISSNQNPTNLKCPMSRADHDKAGIKPVLKKTPICTFYHAWCTLFCATR